MSGDKASSGMQHGGHSMHGMKMGGGQGHAMHGKMNMQPDMDGMKMHGMNHDMMQGEKVIPMDMNPDLPKVKLPIKKGPHTTMWVENPQYRLEDPGVGLRNNGRRVLTYADLKNYHPTAHWPKPTREMILHLTGNMSRYMWSINGIPYEEADPLEFIYGERLRITFINNTMMNHPMHLHGMWSDLETGDENHIPRKHTIIVQPGSKISMRVTVDAPGRWVFHCHLLYHMGGMFREVTVVDMKKV